MDEKQEAKVPGKLFDQQIGEELTKAITDVLTRHCDVLRSVGVFFDYHGNLNDADITKGIWLGPEGPVGTPAGIFGSLGSCTNLLGTILDRAMRLSQHLKDQTAQALAELKRVQEQIQKTKAEQNGQDALV